ncbi:MAG: tRNA (adenosine(37)-N6)-threonylcarbamoyltransferase complex transferase subunit TsaD [Kiritimatiellia bacterium]
MIVLGIESSCDETAAAVVQDGTDVLSSSVYSQVKLHQPYGGVVPEIASRSHVEKIPEVIVSAVSQAFGGGGSETPDPSWWRRIDAVAVTYGPGLASSLIVGLSAAKGLALSISRPLIGINHIEAHIHSVFLDREKNAAKDIYPYLALVVSGGHSCLIAVDQSHSYIVIGQTLDDAAGEAFDKAAKLLHLGYPGGPVIDRIAATATRRDSIDFPKGKLRRGNPVLCGMDAELCVSFSGLKTALMYYLRKNKPENDADVVDIAAAYQEAVVDALVLRCTAALSKGRYRALAVGGGVSLNSRLRERLVQTADDFGLPVYLAQPQYCGDNAAMIAGLAGTGGGVCGEKAFELDVSPSLAAGVQQTLI